MFKVDGLCLILMHFVNFGVLCLTLSCCVYPLMHSVVTYVHGVTR